MRRPLLLCLLALAAAAQPAEIGVHVGNETDPARALPRLRELGVTWVRLWADVDWEKTAPPPAFALAETFHAAGLKVLVVCSPHNAEAAALRAGRTGRDYHDPARVAAWFRWALARPGIAAAIDLWEIGNEIHVEKYWRGTLAGFVDRVQTPAYDALHARGERVVGAALTAWQKAAAGTAGYSTAQTAELVRTTRYLATCDYAGIHPYTQTVAQLRDHLAGVAPLFAGKPVAASEWNLKRPTPDLAEWGRRLDEAGALVNTVAAVSIHYRLLASEREGGWPGLCRNDAAYTPVEPFFSLIRRWAAGPSAPSAARPR